MGLKSDHPDRVNAQTGNDFIYFFPVFMHIDPHHANFSSIGPDGGTVVSVAIDPHETSTLYAGSWGNGVFKSVDGGVTWEQKAQGLRVGFIYNIVINPDNHLHLLASVYRFGAYQSFDGGESWAPTTGLPEDTVVYSMKFDPTDTNIVYAAVRLKTTFNPAPQYPGGVYKSTNGGSHWVKKSSGLSGDYVYDIAIDPRYPNRLYTAMHRDGVYKSTNGAESWSEANYNIHYRDIRSVYVNPENSDLYAGMWDKKGAALLKSGTTSWTQIASAVSQNLDIYQLQLDPHKLDTLYLSTSSGLYRCVGAPYPSGSTSCQLFAHANAFICDLALDLTSSALGENVKTMYSGMVNIGVHKSVNAGASFTPSYAGIKSNVILSILNDPLDPSVLYASALGRGVFKSMDEGQNWSALTNGLPNNTVNTLVFKPGDSSVLYAGSQSAGIFISNNSGDSWTSANSGLSRAEIALDDINQQDQQSLFSHPTAFAWMAPIDIEAMRVASDDQNSLRGTGTYPEILSISINPLNPSRMIAGSRDYGMFRSDDGGYNWTGTNLTTGTVFDSFVDHSQPTYTYYSGVFDSGVRVSDNSRFYWPTRSSGLHSGADIYGLAMSAPGRYFAASDNGVYVTYDAGLSWLRTGLTGIRLYDVHSDPANPSVVWAASTEGIYRSLDGGQTWYWLGRQKLNDQFLTITQGSGNYDVYFGMSGGNIYRMEP